MNANDSSAFDNLAELERSLKHETVMVVLYIAGAIKKIIQRTHSSTLRSSERIQKPFLVEN